MNAKPSDNEEEYFARLEVDRRRKVALERQAVLQIDEREQERTLHFMRCPKCGHLLEDIAFKGTRVDKCFGCEGLWLDKGELETLHVKGAGFIARLLKVFR